MLWVTASWRSRASAWRSSAAACLVSWRCRRSISITAASASPMVRASCRSSAENCVGRRVPRDDQRRRPARTWRGAGPRAGRRRLRGAPARGSASVSPGQVREVLGDQRVLAQDDGRRLAVQRVLPVGVRPGRRGAVLLGGRRASASPAGTGAARARSARRTGGRWRSVGLVQRLFERGTPGQDLRDPLQGVRAPRPGAAARPRSRAAPAPSRRGARAPRRARGRGPPRARPCGSCTAAVPSPP